MTEIKNELIPDDIYFQIVKNIPICTVDILIFNSAKNQVLLFKRTKKPIKGEYFSPGGRMLKNETFEQAAVRQLQRELDLNISANELHLAGVINEIFEDSAFEGVNYHTVNTFFYYICDQNLNIKLDNQHEHGDWFNIQDESLHPLIQQKIKQCQVVFSK